LGAVTLAAFRRAISRTEYKKEKPQENTESCRSFHGLPPG